MLQKSDSINATFSMLDVYCWCELVNIREGGEREVSCDHVFFVIGLRDPEADKNTIGKHYLECNSNSRFKN